MALRQLAQRLAAVPLVPTSSTAELLMG